jgi:alpha-galactosidase/6-phospho-beta-glucosidase family protein
LPGLIQVAGYKPGTVIDFEVPKKRGLRQTIADTIGVGGIARRVGGDLSTRRTTMKKF